MRVSRAATYVGVHPDTLRDWADAGRVASSRVAGERRFRTSDLDALIGRVPAGEPDGRRIAVYCRTSGSDQKSSLEAQRDELCAGLDPHDVKVFSEVGSGLSMKRKRLTDMLDQVAAGDIRQIRVTHRDRLARFGVEFAQRFCDAHRCELVVLHDDTGGEDPTAELLADFMSLVASFAGRMYGMRSSAAKRRLLDAAGSKVPGKGPVT